MQNTGVVFPLEDEGRMLAYLNFVRRGGGHGFDLADWYAAKEALILEKNYDRVADYALVQQRKVYLGDRENRRCRFCGRSKPEATFREETHALPHLVGNRSIISLYECDACNARFARSLDDHLGKFLLPSRTLLRIRGRTGVPTYKSAGGKSRIDVVGNRIEIHDVEGDRITTPNFAENRLTIEGDSQRFVPLAVFKAFVKMALSIMPEEEIGHFAGALADMAETPRYDQWPGGEFMPVPLDMHVLVNPLSRRRMLQATGAAGLAACGFSASSTAAPTRLPADNRLFGRAKSVIFLWLSGGPPQHETFDPKPDAPVEIRGPFKPISTNVPGIHFSELLPRIAAMADKLAVVRSLFTNNNIHGGSGYWVLTGRQLIAGDGENSRPDDWPFIGSIVKLLKPSEKLPALTSVTLPEIFLGNGGNLHAGQFGGFLGTQWDPEIITCNPADPKFRLSGDYTGRVSADQLRRRAALLEQVDRGFWGAGGSTGLRSYDHLQRQALDLLSSSGACGAFSLADESPRTRERYGRQHWGQSVLLARRLVEAGVRFVTVNWPRAPGDRGVDNPLWDTHARNFDRMEDVLAPQFDVGFTALLEDLEQRGLLAETLVVAVGEFGRTPKVNANAGRDHWGGVFSAVLAGAGISGGQVLGASDKQGAYPSLDAVHAGHLPATIFHLLGISPEGTFPDRAGRPLNISDAQPLYKLLGERPATTDRTWPTGDVARVPPFASAPLLEPDFTSAGQLRPVEAPANPKGWRAAPIVTNLDRPAFGVALISHPARAKGRQAVIGILGESAADTWHLEPGSQAILAQQIRDPQAGRFVVTLAAQGDGSSKAFYEEVFQKNFRCRLTIFQYTDPAKNPWQHRELASVEIRPAFRSDSAPKLDAIVLDKFLGNPGANFSFGLGIGMAVIVQRSTDGAIEVPARAHAFLRIDRVDVRFEGLVL